MSFDIPLHIADNSPEALIIEAIVLRDHVSPEEVVRRALKAFTIVPRGPELKDGKRKSAKVSPLTDEELKRFDDLYPGLSFGGITDEQWQHIEEGTLKLRQEGLPIRV
jgi:hypothetical protein